MATIYRFTPPTCTLEIQTKRSIISNYLNVDRLRNFKFKLSFDDPCLPTDKQVTITGDRLNLELLKTAVDRYLRGLVANPFPVTEDGARQQQFSKNIPYLQAKGLTECELFFGNLQRDSDREKLNLTTVQLFDLVTALEEYQQQVIASAKTKNAPGKIIPLWTGIAAVAIAGIGITTILLQPTPVENIAASDSATNQTGQEFNDVVPPQIPARAKKETPQPKIDESLTATEKLPPPPAVDTPKPQPNIPNPEDYSLDRVARQSGLKQPVKPQTPAESITNIPTPANNIPVKSEDRQLESAEKLAGGNNNNLENSISKISRDRPVNSLATAQEVKAYFQQKWQPPEDLRQSLEYRLQISKDGAIERVIPLGKAATLYLDRTGIPVTGKSFISPKTQKSTVRLLLNPDGGVKTFQE